MRCIINVIIGNNTDKQKKYIEKQERLRKSLEKHFNGTFLSWNGEFPNDNYNKKNPYNVKAAAFEEAIKQGYKQILWVDSPVVAIRDVSPLFDMIEKDGYLTVKNNNWNCAQSVNDKCLKYFGITRDEAENVHEHAGGFIGVDITNPKGEALIGMFIRACKDGAADGSRYHDNQSSDPRFLFHRHCQSVITLSANKLGLPYTILWNKGPVALNPSKIHNNTIMAGGERQKHSLDNKYIQQGGTLKNTKRNNVTRKHKESYIYFIAYGGLSDNISELCKIVEYAKKHKRSILLELNTYSASDIKDIFDFSNFPVPVYTNKEKIQKLIHSHKLYPSVNIDNIKGKLAIKGDQAVKRGTPGSTPLTYNSNVSYPRDTIIISARGGGIEDGNELYFFRNVTLKPDIIARYREYVKQFNIPDEYAAVHLRATDKPLSFKFNILGLKKSESHGIKKGDVDSFIQTYAPMSTFIASDNKEIIESYRAKYPSVIHGDAAFKSKQGNKVVKKRGLHRNGSKDPSNLVDAVIDLIVLAKAKVLMTSVGGYTQMAKMLWENKDVVAHLLRED